MYTTNTHRLDFEGPEQKEIVFDKEFCKGTLLLTNLSFTENYFGLNLTGNIINNTTRDWNIVIFEVELFDQVGNKLKSNSASQDFTFKISEPNGLYPVYGIKKGEQRAFSETLAPLYFNKLRYNQKQRHGTISKYDIQFRNGVCLAEYTFVMVKPNESEELTFNDSFIGIQFSISKEQIDFILQNKTNTPIKIDWNQVSYVDIFSTAHRVIHTGIRYLEKDKPQAQTLIPPTAKIEDVISPSDYINYTSGKYGGWEKNPLFPESSEAKQNYENKSFSIFMPLEIDGVVKNYTFTFEIVKVINAEGYGYKE